MENKKYDIFISYRHNNMTLVGELVAKLEQYYDIFWDCRLESGYWDEQLKEAIDDSRVVVINLNTNSLKKNELGEDWFYKEIVYSMNKKDKKAIIPICYDGYKIPEVLQIERITEEEKDKIEILRRKQQAIMDISSLDGIVSKLVVDLEKLGIKTKIPYDPQNAVSECIKFDLIHPNKPFVGRTEELSKINIVDNNVVFLSGIGGIGKTELAKKYMEQATGEYRCVFCKFDTSIKDTLGKIKIKVSNGKGTEEKEVNDIDEKNREKTLKKLLNEKVLLIVDNFDFDLAKDEDIENISEYIKELCQFSCKKLITTRNKFDKISFDCCKYETINIGALDYSELKELFIGNKNNFSDFDDKKFETILDFTEGLTLAVSIMGSLYNKPGMTMDKLCQYASNGISELENAGKVILNKDGKSKRGTATDIIRFLFNIEGMDDAKKNILRNLSLLQFIKVTGDLYNEIACNNEGVPDEFEDLIDTNWIKEIQGEDTYYELHPIINDLVKDDLTPTPENCPEVFAFFAEKMEQHDYFTFIRFVEEINYDNRENYLYLARYIKKLTYNSKMKQSKLIKIMVEKLLQDDTVYDNSDLEVIDCVFSNTALIDLKFIEKIIDKLCLSLSVNSIDKDKVETIILRIGMCARTGSVKREGIFEHVCKKIQKSVEQYSEYINHENIVEAIKRLDNSIENSMNLVRTHNDDLAEKIYRSKDFDDSLHILIDNYRTVVNYEDVYFRMQYEYGAGVCIREIFRKYLYTGITVSEVEKIFKSIDNKMVGNELCKLKNKIKKEFCYVYKRKNIICLSFEKCCEFINSISEYSDDKTVKLSASLLCGDTDKYKSVFEKLILNKPIDKKSKDELHKDFQVVREAHKLIDLDVDIDIAQADDIILPVLRYVESIENSLGKDDEYNRLIKAWYRYLKSISIGTSYYEKCKEKFEEWETKIRGFELKPQKG